MKIANVIRRFLFEEWGGTECAVWNLSKCYQKLGHTAEILSTKSLCNVPNEVLENVKISRFDYFYPYLFLNKASLEMLDKKGGNPFSIDLYKKLLDGNFDVIHSHTLGRIAKESVKAAKKLGTASVLSFHGGFVDVPKSEIESMSSLTKNKIAFGKVVEKICALPENPVAEADGIICVGKNEYEKIYGNFPHKKIAYIPNGVNFEIFSQPTNIDFKGNYGVPKNRKLLLCVSRIDPQKNQLFLISLLERLLKLGENVHLALVGFVTNKGYLDKIKDASRELNLFDRLTVCEGLPPDSAILVSAYKAADVFVLPSVHEPFGIVALEAWATGTPVIASDVGGLSHLIESGKNGLLFDVNSIEGAVNAYFDAKKNSANIVKIAQEECRLNYSWQSIAEKTLNFYKEVKDG